METKTEQERMHALALSTAQRIEEEAAAVKLLEEHEGTAAEDLDVDEYREVRAAREVLDLPPIEPDEDAAEGLEEARDRLRFEGPLSIRRYGYNDGDGWETESVTIVLGTGGPHVEVQYRGDRATVVAFGWFGADRVELPVDADAVETVYGVDHLYHDEY